MNEIKEEVNSLSDVSEMVVKFLVHATDSDAGELEPYRDKKRPWFFNIPFDHRQLFGAWCHIGEVFGTEDVMKLKEFTDFLDMVEQSYGNRLTGKIDRKNSENFTSVGRFIEYVHSLLHQQDGSDEPKTRDGVICGIDMFSSTADVYDLVIECVVKRTNVYDQDIREHVVVDKDTQRTRCPCDLRTVYSSYIYDPPEHSHGCLSRCSQFMATVEDLVEAMNERVKKVREKDDLEFVIVKEALRDVKTIDDLVELISTGHYVSKEHEKALLTDGFPAMSPDSTVSFTDLHGNAHHVRLGDVDTTVRKNPDKSVTRSVLVKNEHYADVSESELGILRNLVYKMRVAEKERKKKDPEEEAQPLPEEPASVTAAGSPLTRGDMVGFTDIRGETYRGLARCMDTRICKNSDGSSYCHVILDGVCRHTVTESELWRLRRLIPWSDSTEKEPAGIAPSGGRYVGFYDLSHAIWTVPISGLYCWDSCVGDKTHLYVYNGEFKGHPGDGTVNADNSIEVGVDEWRRLKKIQDDGREEPESVTPQEPTPAPKVPSVPAQPSEQSKKSDLVHLKLLYDSHKIHKRIPDELIELLANPIIAERLTVDAPGTPRIVSVSTIKYDPEHDRLIFGIE